MVRKVKRKKKKYIVLKLFVGLCLVIFSLFHGLEFKYKNNFTDKDREYENIRKKYDYIDVTISKINEDEMEVISKNDSMYIIKYKSDDVLVGDNLRIFYDGEFDDFKEVQDINVQDVEKRKLYLGYDDSVLELLNNMTLSEKIGQLLLVRVPSYNKIKTISDYHIGGYLLFGRDVGYKSKNTLLTEIKNYQNEAKIPLIIAIDEEGGTVSRLSNNYNIVKTPFKSPRALYNSGGFEAIKSDGNTKMALLKDLAINMNLAPVVDIVTNKNAYMYSRSIGLDKDGTANFVKTIMDTQLEDVSYTLKHFPGYGNNIDTHNGIATDNRSYDEFLSNDFVPFLEGIKSGARSILVSHNIVTCMDSVPASISRVSHNILRNELNFKGIIITDDVDMSGLKKYDDNPYLEAILAGNNILIVSDYENAFDTINKALNDGLISSILLDRLVLRTLQFKYNYIK